MTSVLFVTIPPGLSSKTLLTYFLKEQEIGGGGLVEKFVHKMEMA
jgi:hypothetical protein